EPDLPEPWDSDQPFELGPFEPTGLEAVAGLPMATTGETPLQRWLHHQQTSPEAAPEPTGPLTTAQDPEIEKMRAQLALIKARAQLLADPGWLDEPVPGEKEADHQAAAQIRGMRREQSLATAMAHGKLGSKARRVDKRLARIELADRLWSRKALARRNRLLNPASRLAGLHRAHVASSTALIGVATAGIAWTSAGVHDAIVGPNGSTLAYVVEPIFSIPLLVIMAIAAHATGWNQTFPPPAQRTRVCTLEAFLLTSTIAMNTVSVLPETGIWHNTA